LAIRLPGTTTVYSNNINATVYAIAERAAALITTDTGPKGVTKFNDRRCSE